MSFENSNILVFKARPLAETPEAGIGSAPEVLADVFDLGAYRELGRVATIECDLTSINTLKKRLLSQFEADLDASISRHPAGKARTQKN